MTKVWLVKMSARRAAEEPTSGEILKPTNSKGVSVLICIVSISKRFLMKEERGKKRLY
jgi:hypothetical protein